MSGRGGRRAGAGRPVGAVNKDTADIRALILGALQDVGGRAYLAHQAIETPTSFMALLGKVLPTQITGENGTAIAVDFRWADAMPAQHEVIEADESMVVSFVTADPVNEC